MTEIEQKESDMRFYRKGLEDGDHRARCQMTIQLVNEYHGNGYPHSWFGPINWFRRDLRLRTFIEQLWQQYGPTEYDTDDE